MFPCFAHPLKIGIEWEVLDLMEVLLGSEDCGVEEERFGHGAGASAELSEHRQHEPMLLGVSFVVRFQPHHQELRNGAWWKLL